MRVAHIITSLNTGGAEKLIIDSIPHYEKKGISADVIILKDKISPFRKILSSKIKGNIIGVSKKSIYNPLLILKLIPYLKKYDVIHAHLFPTLYWVALAKLISFNKINIIYTEHNTDNRRRDYFFFKWIDLFIYKRIAHIGCISNATYNNLNKYLNFKVKTSIINNGIDLSKFKNINIDKQNYKFLDNESFYLIQVSSFRSQKDQETLINSMPLLPNKIKLLLVGNGVLKAERQKQVISMNLSDRVFFLGERFDIPELLSLSDIVILSSIYEGFGLAIVEGMASKKPVIASDIDGLREVVKDYGLVFKRQDEKDLASKILSLFNDKDYYEKIADICENRANDFSINKMTDEYYNLYKKVFV